MKFRDFYAEVKEKLEIQNCVISIKILIFKYLIPENRLKKIVYEK
jgi:hypothetical protein